MANKCSELSPWNYRMDYESKRVHQQHKISNENRFCQPFPNNMFIVLNCSPCRHALSSIRYYYFETKTIFTHTLTQNVQSYLSKKRVEKCLYIWKLIKSHSFELTKHRIHWFNFGLFSFNSKYSLRWITEICLTEFHNIQWEF